MAQSSFTLFGSPTYQYLKTSFDLSDSQTQSYSMSISFAPIQKDSPLLPVRKVTNEEIYNDGVVITTNRT